jgi:uncharacterized protein
MDPATELRAARTRAGLTQGQLAARTGTSQATLSAYETGRKQPTLATFGRLLAATGAELRVTDVPGRRTAADLARAGRHLEEVLALAEELPFRRPGPLAFPGVPRP